LHSGFVHLHQVYTHAKKDFSGRVTVPVLYDVTLDTIACNESMPIIELLNGLGDNNLDLTAPAKNEKTAAEYENLKKDVVSKFNTGVYAAGLAKTQQAYEQNVATVYTFMDLLEEKLGHSRFIFGEKVSLIDIRVFITYLRYIFAYRILFKLDQKNYTSYPNLNRFLLDFYQTQGIQQTVSTQDIKEGYFGNFVGENGVVIIPLGPDFDLNQKIEVKH